MRTRILGFSGAAALAACLLFIGTADGAFAQGQDRIVVGPANESARLSIQRSLGERIRALLAPGAAGTGILMLVAAGYGVVHALGPGHQKTLLGGYFLSEGGRLGTIAAAAAATAALHAAAVLVLFGGAALVLGTLPMAAADKAREAVTRISGIALLALALSLTLRRLRDAIARLKALSAEKEAHHHGEGHECAACARMETQRKRGAPLWSILLAGGLAPCPGAALFMLYGIAAGNAAAGALAVLAISAGMGITLFLISWAAASLRDLSLKASQRSYAAQAVARSLLEVGGSVIMVFFASLLVL